MLKSQVGHHGLLKFYFTPSSPLVIAREGHQSPNSEIAWKLHWCLSYRSLSILAEYRDAWLLTTNHTMSSSENAVEDVFQRHAIEQRSAFSCKCCGLVCFSHIRPYKPQTCLQSMRTESFFIFVLKKMCKKLSLFFAFIIYIFYQLSSTSVIYRILWA